MVGGFQRGVLGKVVGVDLHQALHIRAGGADGNDWVGSRVDWIDPGVGSDGGERIVGGQGVTEAEMASGAAAAGAVDLPCVGFELLFEDAEGGRFGRPWILVSSALMKC